MCQCILIRIIRWIVVIVPCAYTYISIHLSICVGIHLFSSIICYIYIIYIFVTYMLYIRQAKYTISDTQGEIAPINNCERTSPVTAIRHLFNAEDIDLIRAFWKRSYTITKAPRYRRKFDCRNKWYLCCVCQIESPETVCKTSVYYVCIWRWVYECRK